MRTRARLHAKQQNVRELKAPNMAIPSVSLQFSSNSCGLRRARISIVVMVRVQVPGLHDVLEAGWHTALHCPAPMLVKKELEVGAGKSHEHHENGVHDSRPQQQALLSEMRKVDLEDSRKSSQHTPPITLDAVEDNNNLTSTQKLFPESYQTQCAVIADTEVSGARPIMASAKFLEEALNTDVDESAVNAIVGSLETQLVTAAAPAPVGTTVSSQQVPIPVPTPAPTPASAPTPAVNQVPSNGPSPLSILSTGKVITSSSGVVHPGVVTAALHSGVPAAAAGGTYLNQKAPEVVKIVYPSAGQTFTAGTLANGNMGLVAPLAVTSGVQNVVSQTFSQAPGATGDQNKGTNMMIQANPTTGPVNSPMTLPGGFVNTVTTSSGMSGMMAITKPVIPAGVSPGTAIIQLVNVRGAAPGVPTTTALPRLVVGPTGQLTLGGLPPGTPGTLLLRAENGQYQLLRVGPAPVTSTTAAVPATSSTSVATTTVTTMVTATTNSVPSVSYRIQPSTPVQTCSTTSSSSALTTSQNGAVQRHPVGTTKEKCRKFLANLLELSSRESEAVERNVRTLIQELIDMKLEPEEFCDRLERLLNASPQPCLIGFLKKSLPLLRQALITKELVIDGIRAPPPQTVLFPVANAAGTVIPQLTTQLRPQPATSQVRLMAPVNTSTPSRAPTTAVPRAGQTLQTHRLVVPVRAQSLGVRVLQQQSGAGTSAVTGPIRGTGTLLSPLPLQVKSSMDSTTGTLMVKPSTPVYPKTATVSFAKSGSPIVKAVPPSLLPKPPAKAKEKKAFCSAGYAGDDDINDVAAMGGVNLAEETQRILGSTDFVGTEIRSCKDETFLHSGPLQCRIRQIAARHGLEEPPAEVAALVSHACQERLKTLLQKLSVIGEHRLDVIKLDPRFEVLHDVKGQLKFLEELDRVERKRHDEHERELLLRAAKSRSKSEDPEQAKLKAKAKEMQRTEMEEIRQQETNLTALQAIGPRKKPRLDTSSSDTLSLASGAGSSLGDRPLLPVRPRLKRINVRDLLFLLERERDACNPTLLYRSYLR